MGATANGAGYAIHVVFWIILSHSFLEILRIIFIQPLGKLIFVNAAVYCAYNAFAGSDEPLDARLLFDIRHPDIVTASRIQPALATANNSVCFGWRLWDYAFVKNVNFSQKIVVSVEHSPSHILPIWPINYSQVMCSSFNQTSFTLGQPLFLYIIHISALASNPLLFPIATALPQSFLF